MTEYVCEFCPKRFRTERGLNRHQGQGKCWVKKQVSLGVDTGPADMFPDDVSVAVCHAAAASLSPMKRPPAETADTPKQGKKQRMLEEDDDASAENESLRPRKLLDLDDPKKAADEMDSDLDERKMAAQETNSEADDADDGFMADEEDNYNGMTYDEDTGAWQEPPDDIPRKEFRDYCANGKAHFAPFDEDQEAAIRLLDILRRKKAPLDTYDSIMTWHLLDKGSILPGEKAAKSGTFLGRKALLKMLAKRYHMEEKYPYVVPIVLPHSRAKVEIVVTTAALMIESLLTDPRLKDDDFSFFDNNPLADPPDDLDYVGELNTGTAFIAGHKKLKTSKRKVPIGIQWYIDGAVTGQFANLSITALKMTLSCFTSKYRMNEHAWRTLGYVVEYSKPGSRGKHLFVDSKHMDAAEVDLRMADKKEGDKVFKGPEAVEKAQDFHAQIECILASYLDTQSTGMMWDLPYRGRLYKDLELVFFSIMVKCDTDEAELLCGKYRVRSQNVSNLCRYCTCPNEKTDDPRADYPLKTVTMIDTLVRAKDYAGLQKLLQQYIHNAWYKVEFSPINDRGIHGACPSEMLHALLLGIFKYVRENFFIQVGKDTPLGMEIDGLATQYGSLFGRQSERDIPKCKFANGIRLGGKLMAKEYRGVLLLMAVVLRSTEGQKMLKVNKNFAKPFLIKDWLLLVEMLLEWEAFLCEPRMQRKHVERLELKNRFIMHLIKKIVRRSKGMGMRLMKFHAIVHLAWDILLYGVPMEHDTGANESHHKATKVAARLTQKKYNTFEIQTATRMTEFHVIQLAMLELQGRKLYRYYEGFIEPSGDYTTHAPPCTGEEFPTEGESGTDGSESSSDSSDSNESMSVAGVFVTKGTKIVVFEDEYGDANIQAISRMQNPTTILWDNDLRDFLFALQGKVADYQESLVIRTEHHRNGQIFRSHPQY